MTATQRQVILQNKRNTNHQRLSRTGKMFVEISKELNKKTTKEACCPFCGSILKTKSTVISKQ